MSKEEIKEYLKRVDELGTKLTGEDKETYAWLIYGYNQCAKLLNETEQQCKKQKEVIDKAINNSQYWIDYYTRLNSDERIVLRLQENIDILKGESNE